MKKMAKSILGVTLLEIMLVLAIAAMIIVMSVRYYQSASTSNQVNMAMNEIQAYTAAMDNLAIGSSTGYSAITSTQIAAVVGANNLISPTGQSVTVAAASSTTYTVSMPLNTAICTSVSAKLAANAKMTSVACSATGTLSYTYDNTK